jgi:AcrR family transcriptional regulator
MRPALTRSSIVEAARGLLVAEGLDAVSLRRIASHLGVTAPALYAYVTDKRDLLRAIASMEIEKLLREFDSVDAEDPTDRLEQLAQCYLDFARTNAEVFRAVFLTRPELTAEPYEGEAALASKILERVTNAMRDALSGRAESEVDASLAGLTYWAATHGAVVMLLSGPRLHPDDDANLVRSVSGAVLRGLGFDRAPAFAAPTR